MHWKPLPLTDQSPTAQLLRNVLIPENDKMKFTEPSHNVLEYSNDPPFPFPFPPPPLPPVDK